MIACRNRAMCLRRYLLPSPLPRAIVNKCGGVFVTKMAVYQPRRETIATVFVTVIQDDICEELLSRHKRGIKLPLHFSLPGFLDFSRFCHSLASASLSSEYSSKLFLCCSSQDDGNAVVILH